ncbi:MAG: glycosyltransferase family 2 protein, partial [Ilumatobacteraceae bacterium]
MITVVVTTYSAPAATLAKCLQSVIEAGGADAVIVVDNGGLAHIPAHLAGSVELVRAAANHGFGAAANLGFARARQLGATAIALLNDDIEVEPGWLDALHDELVTGATGPAGAKPRVGAVQPKLLMAHSDPPMINSVGVRLDRYGAGQDIGFDEPDGPAFDIPTDIDIFTGGAVLFSTAFLDDLDGFDERYFMYYEDVDLALRGQRRGWVYRCAPASRVWHEGGVSADGAPA